MKANKYIQFVKAFVYFIIIDIKFCGTRLKAIALADLKLPMYSKLPSCLWHFWDQVPSVGMIGVRQHAWTANTYRTCLLSTNPKIQLKTQK